MRIHIIIFLLLGGTILISSAPNGNNTAKDSAVDVSKQNVTTGDANTRDLVTPHSEINLKAKSCDEKKEDINAGLKTGDINCKNQSVTCYSGHCWVPVPEVHRNPAEKWISKHWDIFVVLGIIIICIILIIYLVCTDREHRMSDRESRVELARLEKETHRSEKLNKDTQNEPNPVVFVLDEGGKNEQHSEECTEKIDSKQDVSDKAKR